MSIRSLAPQHILRFFHFCLRQFCSLLCRSPQRSNWDRKKNKKKTRVCNGLLIPGNRHRVKYGLDYFLDHFFFWTILKGGESTPLVLREGWEAECYYPGRGERRTIFTQGGVGGGCNSKHYWFNWFFDWIFVWLNFSAGPWRFFIFSSCGSETAT